MQSVFDDQREALLFVLNTPRVLVPAVVRWSERFGAGLETPVLPFFMLALNLSPSQMGALSTISVVSAILPSPIFGCMLDRYGPYYTIVLASAACGIGCGLQGVAQGYSWLAGARIFQGIGGFNMPTMINAHITACTPVSQRALTLSAFTAQGLFLRILGQGCYLPWDSMLRALGLERMLRFRVTLSVCTLFCWFGVGALVHSGDVLRRQITDQVTGPPQADEGEATAADDAGCKRAEGAPADKEGVSTQRVTPADDEGVTAQHVPPTLAVGVPSALALGPSSEVNSRQHTSSRVHSTQLSSAQAKPSQAKPSQVPDGRVPASALLALGKKDPDAHSSLASILTLTPTLTFTPTLTLSLNLSLTPAQSPVCSCSS